MRAIHSIDNINNVQVEVLARTFHARAEGGKCGVRVCGVWGFWGSLKTITPAEPTTVYVAYACDPAFLTELQSALPP